MKCILLTVLLLLPSIALAQVTVQLSPSTLNPGAGELNVILTGDAADVTLTLPSPFQWDWCDPKGVTGTNHTPTVPDLGDNNDSKLAAVVTLKSPLTTICDVDDNGPFPSVTATIGGVIKPLMQSNGIWSATFSGITPPSPPTVTGTSTLTWIWAAQAPYTGTPDGFRVYWGQVQGSYSNSAVIRPPATTYVVTGLAPGIWYFAVSALDGASESALSNVASKTIPSSAPLPTDCVVSAWVQGAPQPTACPASGTQTRIDMRTIVTPASNGGAACPALTQTVSLACTPPPVDPCVSTPLLISALKWPTARNGARSFSWTASQNIVGLQYAWPLGQKQTASFTDDRGCSALVSH